MEPEIRGQTSCYWIWVGIWNWCDAFARRSQIQSQVRGKCAKVADGCWIILQNEQLASDWSPGGQYLGHFVGSVSWEAKTKDPQGGEEGDVRKIFSIPPNRSACKAGLPTQTVSPQMWSVIKISFFPIWDITIPIYLPPLLTALYFLDDSEVRTASGDQYSLFLNWITKKCAFPHLPVTISNHSLGLFYANPIGPECVQDTSTSPWPGMGNLALEMVRYVGRTEILNLLLLMVMAPQELLFQKEYVWLSLVLPHQARRSTAQRIRSVPDPSWSIGRQDRTKFYNR